MKKVIYLVLCVIILLACVACKISEEKPDEENSVVSYASNTAGEEYYNTFEKFEASFSKVEQDNKNYVVKSSDKHAGNFYEIYDNDGNLLDKGFHDWRGSFDILQKGDIIKLEYGFGGTGVHPQYRLYDVKNSVVSRYFGGPVAINDNHVAYFNVGEDRTVLVVQDAFDKKEYYKEFTGKFDEFILMKIQDINFSGDGTQITIKHCETNNEENIIEETFDLN